MPRTCSKCKKELFDKGLSVSGLKGDGLHPECFVAKLKKLVTRGHSIALFGPIPLEEQAAILDSDEFLEAMTNLTIADSTHHEIPYTKEPKSH